MECGTEVVAERLHVCVEGDNGDRWYLAKGFDTIQPGYDEEGGFPTFARVKDEAEAKVNALIEKIKAAGVVNLDLWVYDPVYGSNAYINSGAEQARKIYD